MSNGVFNINFLVLLLSEILGGPKFTLGAIRPLDAPRPVARGVLGVLKTPPNFQM